MTERLDHLIDLLRLLGEARREGYTEEAEDLGKVISEISLEIIPYLEKNPLPNTEIWRNVFLCSLDFDKNLITSARYERGNITFWGGDRELCSINLTGIYSHAKNIENRVLQP